MKVGIVGYGKMGQAVEKSALLKGHSIGVILKKPSDWKNKKNDLLQCDVLIEFSTPEAAYYNVLNALELALPIVCGTTGWLEHFEKIKLKVETTNGAFLYASNFSIGVNQFFYLLEKAGEIFSNPLNPLNLHIKEIHHIHKKDAPSGTAITMQNIVSPFSRSTVGITSERLNEVPGTHILSFSNQLESVEIKHTALSREGFADGAVNAAEWIVGKSGFFTMKDLLGF
jgi:4-hydroxy-tetrahydrodipicolinate reductase